MTDKETLDARIDVARAFSGFFLNPLFHKEFLLKTETSLVKEYNNIIVAGPEEKIGYTLERFFNTGDAQASIVSLIDGEIMLRIVSLITDKVDGDVFDIYSDTTVYSWLNDENMYPEGIHESNGRQYLVAGNFYRKSIEKICGFADN